MHQPKIAAVHVAKLGEAFEQSLVVWRFFFRVAGMPKVANRRNFPARLRPCNIRRCGQRTAEERYEFTSSHRLLRGSGQGIVSAQTSALEGGSGVPANVRFGSKADMCSAIANVRFTPNSDRKSGHQLRAAE